MVAAVVCDGGSGEEEDGRVQTALVQLHHRAVADPKVRGIGGFVPERPEPPGLGVEGAVELLRPTEPHLSRLQLRTRGTGQGRGLGGRREEG